ncbi:unnamed protein product [Prorocentrum cordatum]|uniref:Uncharacterized protein n=1 Tax=Prorocentrum cordatum TaxID=2364126 RepID=A0ABN9YEN6_9DINO|nr:unnamed protein product [Polarella glacialis]
MTPKGQRILTLFMCAVLALLTYRIARLHPEWRAYADHVEHVVGLLLLAAWSAGLWVMSGDRRWRVKWSEVLKLEHEAQDSFNPRDEPGAAEACPAARCRTVTALRPRRGLPASPKAQAAPAAPGRQPTPPFSVQAQRQAAAEGQPGARGSEISVPARVLRRERCPKLHSLLGGFQVNEDSWPGPFEDIYVYIVPQSSGDLTQIRSFVEKADAVATRQGRVLRHVLFNLNLNKLRGDIEFAQVVVPLRPGLATPKVQYDFLSTFRNAFFIRFGKYTMSLLRKPFNINYTGGLRRARGHETAERVEETVHCQ